MDYNIGNIWQVVRGLGKVVHLNKIWSIVLASSVAHTRYIVMDISKYRTTTRYGHSFIDVSLFMSLFIHRNINHRVVYC